MIKRQAFFRNVACPIGRDKNHNVTVWVHDDTPTKRASVIALLRLPEDRVRFEVRTAAEINAKIQELYPDTKAEGESEAEAILRSIIETGILLNASDILIEPEPYADGRHVTKGVPFPGKVRYDVEGVLDCAWHIPVGKKEKEEVRFFPSRDLYDRTIRLIRTAAKISDVESRPTDGRYTWGTDGNRVEYRVSIVPTQIGLKAVLRQISAEAKIMPLQELSFPHSYEPALKAIRRKGAFVLIVGVPRAGKTTTAYALINALNLDELNVYTIENPVEAIINGVSQLNIPQGEDTAATTQMTMDLAMTAMVRQRPNLVMVGEIRDAETVRNALTIGSSGVGVLATLHAPRALAAFDRLASIGANEQVMRRNVTAIVAQDLVRRLCTRCRTYNEDSVAYCASEAGCVACNHRGYSGMIALIEIVERHDTDDGTPIWKLGETRMEDMALKAVREGVTDEAEIIRVFGSMPAKRSASVVSGLARSA